MPLHPRPKLAELELPPRMSAEPVATQYNHWVVPATVQVPETAVKRQSADFLPITAEFGASLTSHTAKSTLAGHVSDSTVCRSGADIDTQSDCRHTGTCSDHVASAASGGVTGVQASTGTGGASIHPSVESANGDDSTSDKILGASPLEDD